MADNKLSIYIGWDERERVAWEVARSSLIKHCSIPVCIHRISYGELAQAGIYKRPTERGKHGRLLDLLSARPGYDGSISTEHANARFFVPLLAKTGWSLFTDGDVLFRGDIAEAFRGLDPSKALYCVKHNHQPVGALKMDNQVQTRYERKNWSSFMIFNCDHSRNQCLKNVDGIINKLPGRELHRFCWLADEDIGSLSRRWNYLEGYTMGVTDPLHVHFTEGLPDMAGYENAEYADEWRAERARIGLTPESKEPRPGFSYLSHELPGPGGSLPPFE